MRGDADSIRDKNGGNRGEDACDCVHGGKCPESAVKKHARALETQGLWRLEPHVCRHCFGRLVSQSLPDGDARYQCTNCGAEAVGQEPDVLCSCGTTLRRYGTGSAPADAGLLCQPNPAPTPDFPSLFVAAEART